MKKISRKTKILALVISLVIVCCAGVGIAYIFLSNSDKALDSVQSSVNIKKFDDVRRFNHFGGYQKDISSMDLSGQKDIIPTLWFNQKTIWPKKMPVGCDPEKLLEAAKNPGLGVRELHKQGITGEGINVAIIDQPLFDDHPEFTGKIALYKDFDCKSETSMHGPAVTSLLVGNTIGTAPGAKIYYAAAPSWLADAEYYAKALNWITNESIKLPIDKKIRAVSISAAPSGPGSPFKKNNELWDKAVKRAEENDILVLDCTSNHGIIDPCYLAGENREEPSSYKAGFPGSAWRIDPSQILVPTSPRTTAEEYEKGDYSYQYTGQGGMSWAIPYCTGVLAMGWQVNPELSSKEIVKLLFKSAYKPNSKALIINPPEFIKLVKESR